MKNFKSIQRITFAICLTLTLQGCGKTSNVPFNPAQSSDSGTESHSEGIFSEPNDEDTHVSQTEEINGTRVHQRRLAKLNFRALKRSLEGSTGSVTLNLFKDKTLNIQLDSISKISENNYVATGHIKGDLDSSATLVLNEDVIALTVKSSTDEENYEVRYSKDGHVITEQTEVQDDEHSCSIIEAPDSAENDPIIPQPGEESVLATPTIDMLVAYTPLAKAKAGGENAIKALIQLGVADTNTAFNGSGVNLRVRLAGVIQTSSNETSNYSGDLSALRSSTDRKWNEVHAARRKYGADQVTLIGAYPNVSNPVGIGYFKASKASAFTIVKHSVISTMFTLAHELGHNIGLDHSDGYVNTSGKFRTIMAYGSYKRIRRFSNPNILYNGFKTGTSAKYEASIINANSTRMSGLIP